MMANIFLYAVVLCACFSLAVNQDMDMFDAKPTRSMMITSMMADYDNTVPPTIDMDYPTEVNVSLHIQGINSVNEQHMDFSVNLFITQSWVDRRLESLGLVPYDYLEMDSRLIPKFWVPDLYFVNEKSSSFHTVTVPNKLLHLYEDGTVVYKIRVTVTAACEMELQRYPMDKQNCSLEIKSFGYSNKSLRLNWDVHSPLTRSKHLKMSQFSLGSLHHRVCHDRPPSDEEINMTHGGRQTSVFSCLAVDFLLERSVGFYFIQIYIPSTLIVVLSWVSFVLDVSAVPARISLGILTVLTMTNMKTIAVSSLPKVSYIKAIDVWMASCLAFVFASLLEFAIVNAFARRSDDTKKDPDSPSVKQPFSCATYLRKAKQIDSISLILFPVCFLFFTAIYLLIYVAN